MTSQAVIRRPFLFMTLDAEAHRMIDDAFGDSHLLEIAMAIGTVDRRFDVRRVIESHVRLFHETVNPLPRHIFAAFPMIAKGLNARVVGIADIVMARHTQADAGNAGARALRDAFMAVQTLQSDLIGDMKLMGKIDWLLRLRFDA